MCAKGQLLSIELQLTNIEEMMEIEKSPSHKYHINTFYRQELSMEIKN